MKRIVSLVLMLAMIFSLVGCSKAMTGEADYIEKARMEFFGDADEDVELTYIGEITKGDHALLWMMSGNEHQAHEYLPMSCSVTKEGARVFAYAHKALERGMDIVVLPDWQGGYAFCVNNTECSTIRIEDNGGEKEIRVTEYPFIYYNDLQPKAYSFWDDNGEEIR